MRSKRFSSLRMVLAMALVLALPQDFVQGMYAMQDLVNVPVERLIKNLEAIATNDPKNARVRFNLARVHAMAYALKTDTAQVIKNKENQGAWFGYEPDHVPFKPVSTNDKNKLNAAPRPITPIVIPLREGLTAPDLEDRSARVAFDADGTGLKKSWTWITNDAGWLVYDPHCTGKVGSALQMFGNVTFWMFWENGYQALAALDNDRNGVLAGRELQGLAIWQDIDCDGVSDRGEVKSLMEWGIVGISCRYVRDGKHPDGIAYSPRGIYFRNGSIRPSYDLILRGQ
jgi:hypothetical protein